MKHAAIACLLLTAACAPYQPMTNTWVRTPAAVESQDQALTACRFMVAQDPAAIDWYMVNRAGTPITGSDGALTALTQHGSDQMDRCMKLKGYLVGQPVPYAG